MNPHQKNKIDISVRFPVPAYCVSLTSSLETHARGAEDLQTVWQNPQYQGPSSEQTQGNSTLPSCRLSTLIIYARPGTQILR